MNAESTTPRPAISFGYTIVYVDDVDATLRFFADAFGIERRFLTPEGDYGELATGSTTLAFVSTDLAASNLAAAGGFTTLSSDRPPPAVTITLLADDVAAAVDAALAAGAHRYVDPAAKPWGQVVAYLLDPNGLLIELATPIAH